MAWKVSRATNSCSQGTIRSASWNKVRALSPSRSSSAVLPCLMSSSSAPSFGRSPGISDGTSSQEIIVPLPPMRKRAAPSQSDSFSDRAGMGTLGSRRSASAWAARPPSSRLDEGPQSKRARSVETRLLSAPRKSRGDFVSASSDASLPSELGSVSPADTG